MPITFTDETKVNRFGSDSIVWGYRKKGERGRTFQYKDKDKFRGGGVMLGCFKGRSTETTLNIERDPENNPSI